MKDVFEQVGIRNEYRAYENKMELEICGLIERLPDEDSAVKRLLYKAFEKVRGRNS